MIFVFSGIFLYSIFMIGSKLLDYYRSDRIYSDLKDIYYQDKVEMPPEKTGESSTGSGISIEGTLMPYLPPTSSMDTTQKSSDVKPPIVRQAFSKLQQINPDIIGWVKIPNTVIDYPVLRGKDNEYYLTHSADREIVRNASIFMDYRNNVKIPDFNTVLYGHNMHDGTMFAYLSEYKRESFFKTHPFVYFDTPYIRGIWQVFSIYVTDTDFDYIRIGFKNADERAGFIDSICKKSIFLNNIKVTPEDRILTLSTCSYEFKNARTVIHAKLLRQDKKP